MTGGDSYAQISLLFGNPDMVLIAADTAAAVQRIRYAYHQYNPPRSIFITPAVHLRGWHRNSTQVEPVGGYRQEALDAVGSMQTETEDNAEGDGSNYAAVSGNVEWSLSIDVGNGTEDGKI